MTGTPAVQPPAPGEAAPGADGEFAAARDAFLLPPKTSNAGAIFALSLVLFILVGSARSGGVASLLVVLGVLLFHELGHLAGMRYFGYRDLRIFFIPFFGAAASGRKTGVPLSSQAIVALLGPLPGIVVAFLLAVANVVAPSPLLHDAIVAFAGINAFNLLPIAPLDGAFVFRAAIFSRSRTAETVFQVLAVLASLGVAVLLESWVLGFVALVMLFAVPHQAKVARGGDELRQQASFPSEPTALDEPQQRLLYAKARELQPQANPQQWSEAMRALHERTQWKPPSLGGTVGLLLVWGGGLVFVLAALVLDVLAGRAW